MHPSQLRKLVIFGGLLALFLFWAIPEGASLIVD
jgi:hypothetical protein